MDKIPLKTQSPKWRLSKGDWIGPLMLLVTSVLVMGIEQIILVLTSSQSTSWVVIIALPVLLMLKRLLTQGEPVMGSGEILDRIDPPRNIQEDLN